MKKILIFALMFVPMVSFAAPSVRVLGSGTGTTASSTSGAKITPAKISSVSKSAALNTSKSSSTAGSRVGTLRAVPKVGSGVVSTTGGVSTASRFPVITPAHSYSSITKPQVTGGTTVINGVTEEDVVNIIVQELKKNEDPRVDMIYTGENREAYWRDKNPQLVDQYLNEGYVFMWIEE